MRTRPAGLLSILAALLVPASIALAQPANDACTSAEAIAGFGTFAWDSTLATTDGLPSPACTFFSQDQISNDVWYCWTAPSAGPVEVSTCTQTTLDTRLAAYEGCACPEGSAVLACNDDNSGCGTQTRIQFNAAAGSTYLVRLGSFSAAATGSGTLTIAAYTPTTLGGPFTNPANGHTYYLLPSSGWTRARTDAVALGGDLVTINDADENEWVRLNVLTFDGTGRRGWLGYNDAASEGAFVWSGGGAPTYTNWNTGEPNNSGGTEHYAEMFGSPGGLWNDQPDAAAIAIFGLVEIGSAPPACPADFNRDGNATVQDIFDFLGAYFPGLPAADFNMIGGVTVQDIFDYLSAYFAGCP
jgi:hypothetical protein